MMSTRIIPALDAKAEARFWSKIAIRGSNDCWLWTAGCGHHGYGQFSVGRDTTRAHRIAFFLTTGEQPPVVMHATCDNPPCCNPFHLRGGTDADNTADSVAKGRRAIGVRNGAHTHPERRSRPRGERHGSHTHPERRPRGERQGSAKLTEAIVRQVRTEYAAGGVSLSTLALRYGCSRPTVGKAVRRRTWAHVEVQG